MEETVQVHLVGPEDAERRRLVEALAVPELRVHETPTEAREALEERCLVVLTSAVACSEALTLAREVADEDREWILTRAGESVDGEPAVRALSVGYPVGIGRLPDALADDGDRPIFALPELLRIVARIRHDINNPLTAGLAELQLLLMDVDDPETREALETVQRQLQRIKELVERLSRLRRPTRRVG